MWFKGPGEPEGTHAEETSHLAQNSCLKHVTRTLSTMDEDKQREPRMPVVLTVVLLFQFAGLLLAVFIMELTVGICAAVFKTDYKVAFKESLSESLRHVLSSGKDRSNYYDVARDRTTGGAGQYGTAYDAIDGRDKNYWDVLQRQFKCCGVDGPKDWPDNIRPISCCLDKFCWGDTAVYHQVGCYDTLVEKIHMSTSILVYVGIGIAFVEILGIFLTCWLANAIESDDDEIIKIHNGHHEHRERSDTHSSETPI
ncbi:hypothetical protein HUJ04_000348 [Dendroctonus ponderosae]|nr:hypothetical protein HUJ04_000348 [Dendroctonus ponderosae]KAH1000442.1 hypothetical protein HUJ04_000348 [Dendroctonus ponderosae]